MTEKVPQNSGPQGTIVISNEEELPDSGVIVSFTGDPLELPEKARKELIAIDMSRDDKKFVWILAIKPAFGNNNFLQLVKNAEGKGYKVLKKGLIEINLLNLLYDRRGTNDSQKAASNSSAVIAKFEEIIGVALQESISDVHFEVRPNGAAIRMRKNGEMMEYNQQDRLTFKEANDLCSVIYNVLASTKSVSFDPRVCQQGAVNYNIREQDLKLRYQSVPAYPDGYDVILRVLPIGRSEEFIPLQSLGYTEQQVEELVNISSRPVGALIIAGVTGSGKSTTLKNLLMYLNADTGYRLKIYSIEDPPEYNIAKITQIPVVEDTKETEKGISPFERPIKACMRGDPDIIMIGEVRDKITGDLTKKAVQSGHQVLTTVHTTSALGIIDRFLDFGLSRSVLGSPEFLNGLLYQKLLAKLCVHCAIDFNEHVNSDKATKKDIDLYKRISGVVDPKKYPIKIRGIGCSHCGGQGIKGRTVCAEVVAVDLEMIQLIMDGKILELMKYWRGLSDGNYESENMKGKTCMEHAFSKMLTGLVCPKDVEASFKPIHEMVMMLTNNSELIENKKSVKGSHAGVVNKKQDNSWEDI
jgi:type II secretory ATPase GspE/PulE/Tfp pilus assembly ATPase PilB-like protein